jgi:hypothetical protein
MEEPAGWHGARETPAWLAEHERALDRLRVRVHELETTTEVERDAIAPYAVAAAGIFALLVSLTLPWLIVVESGRPVSGWSLLSTPLTSPVVAGAAYLVLIAIPLQALGLVGRTRGPALVATMATAVAGLGSISVMFTLARDVGAEAGNGSVICLLVLLVLGIAWAGITEGRRWTG